MKAIIDGTVTEISPERWVAFEAFEKGVAKDWPQINDEYWFIGSDGDVDKTSWDGYSPDYGMASIGNIYRTESDALAQVEKLKAKARIDKYIRDNGLEFVPDWNTRVMDKFLIFYNEDLERWCVTNYSVMRHGIYLPYFVSKAHAQQVIDNCTDDLTTLFGI